jgi:integrase
MAKWKDGVALRGKTWWIRAQHEGDRTSGFGSVKKFAFLLEPHQPIPTTKTDTMMLKRRVEDWLIRGKPMPTPKTEPAPELHGYDLINRYIAYRYRARVEGKEPEAGMQSDMDISQERAAQRAFGALPLSAWEQPETFSGYVRRMVAAGYKIATPNRVLASVVRPALFWGINQRPPLLTFNPFGRYQFKIDITAEERRHERCDPDTEAKLLAVCAEHSFGGNRHQGAGLALAEFIILAIDLGAREGELLGLRNADVDWHAHTVKLRKTKRHKETRLVPFNPIGRVAEILKRRRFAGPKAFVTMRRPFKVWVHVVCVAHGIACEYKGRGKYFTEETRAAYKAVNLRLHDLRHEAATWWGLCGVSDASAEFLQGHKSQHDTHGRYKHEELRLATAELREKVWPRENERAQRAA